MKENGTKTEHQTLLCRAVFICVSATPATMDKKGLTRNLARFGSFTDSRDHLDGALLALSGTSYNLLTTLDQTR